MSAASWNKLGKLSNTGILVKERPVKKTIRIPMLCYWEQFRCGNWEDHKGVVFFPPTALFFLSPLLPLFFQSGGKEFELDVFLPVRGGSLEVDGADEGKG